MLRWITSRRIMLCLAVILVTLTLASTTGLSARKTIKIGFLLPLSGSRAAFGQDARNGIEIAIDKINAQGGIKKEYDIVPIFSDVTTVDAGIAEARRLIEIEKVNILSGTFATDIAVACSAIAESSKVIYWEMCSPADAITTRNFKYLFRTCPTGGPEGETMVQFAYDNAEKIGKTKDTLTVAIIGVDSTYGTGVTDGAAKRAKELGLKVVHHELYNSAVTDLSPLVMKLKLAKPDVIIGVTLIDDGSLFYRQARELGLYAKAMIGTGSCFGSGMFFERFGYLSEGVLATNYPTDLSPAGFAPGLPEFLTTYRARNNRDPLVAHIALSCHQGILILQDVLERTKSLSSDDIAAAAVATDIPKGKIGNGWGAKFAPQGDPMRGTNTAATIIVTQWNKGKLYMVWPLAYPGIELRLPFPTWEEREKAKY
ncbi:MAG TPA: ABC transporter substrate-binding protein [Bacillota bacterium]|nr:ABC transporter substrate-binding protein [Bacillota bacterium]